MPSEYLQITYTTFSLYLYVSLKLFSQETMGLLFLYLAKNRIALHQYSLILESCFPILFKRSSRRALNTFTLLYYNFLHLLFHCKLTPARRLAIYPTFFFIQYTLAKVRYHTNSYFSTGKCHLCTCFRGSRCLFLVSLLLLLSPSLSR